MYSYFGNCGPPIVLLLPDSTYWRHSPPSASAYINTTLHVSQVGSGATAQHKPKRIHFRPSLDQANLRLRPTVFYALHWLMPRCWTNVFADQLHTLFSITNVTQNGRFRHGSASYGAASNLPSSSSPHSPPPAYSRIVGLTVCTGLKTVLQ
jgi:hypothetical protein